MGRKSFLDHERVGSRWFSVRSLCLCGELSGNSIHHRDTEDHRVLHREDDSHTGDFHTTTGKPVLSESLIRKVARVVVTRSSSEIGAGFPASTTAHTAATSSFWPLSCSRSLVFFSRPFS